MTIRPMFRVATLGLVLTLFISSASSAGVSVFDAGLVIGIDALDIDSILYDRLLGAGKDEPDFNYAMFTPSPAVAPVPGAFVQGLTGLATCSAMRRRRRIAR